MRGRNKGSRNFNNWMGFLASGDILDVWFIAYVVLSCEPTKNRQTFVNLVDINLVLLDVSQAFFSTCREGLSSRIPNLLLG